MANTVGDPGEDVENGMGESGENVGDVGTKEDGFKCGKERNGDGGSVCGGDEPGRVECQEIDGDWDGGEEELRGERDEEEEGVEEGNDEFVGVWGEFHEGKPEGGEEEMEEIDEVCGGEGVGLQSRERHERGYVFVEACDTCEQGVEESEGEATHGRHQERRSR